MKSAFVPAIIAAFCAVLVITTVVQAVAPVFARVNSALTMAGATAENASGKPVSQR